MKIEVNLSKKYFFIILGAILILTGAIYGYAYGGSEPEVMGHNIGELEGIDCGTGKYLRYVSGVGWSCETDNYEADTKCDSSGECSQVCIGTDCQTTWPSGSGGEDVTLAGAGSFYAYLKDAGSNAISELTTIKTLGVVETIESGGGNAIKITHNLGHTNYIPQISSHLTIERLYPVNIYLLPELYDNYFIFRPNTPDDNQHHKAYFTVEILV